MDQLKNIKTVLAIVIILVIQSELSAQHPAFQKYTRASGLASDYIFDLLQDKNGFLWIATDNGVSIYDGHHFHTYTMTDGLSSNLIYDIFQDHQGALWFGTFGGGIVRFDGFSFQKYDRSDGLLSNSVFQITEDKFGRMYFQTKLGLSVLANGKFISIENEHGKQGTLCRGPAGQIYFSIDSCIYKLQPSNDQELNYYCINPTSQFGGSLMGTTWASIAVLDKDTLLFPCRTSYIKLVTKTDSLFPGTPKHKNELHALLVDRFHRIWAAFKNQIEIKDKNRVTILSRQQGIEPSFVEAILEDSEGTIWIGTFGGGLYKLFGDYLNVYTEKDGMNSNTIHTVFKDSQQNLVAGTSNGINVIGQKDYKLNHFLDNISSEVRAIVQNPNGYYYIGTYLGVIGPIIPGQKKHDYKSLLHKIIEGVSSIYISPSNQMWVGSYGGGIYLYENKDSLKYTMNDGLASNMIEKIVPGVNSLWFLSKDHGATRYKNKTFCIFSKLNGLPSNYTSCVLEENDGTVWFGTDRGLTMIKNGKTRTYTKKDGLQSNNIIGVFRTSGDSLFVFSEKVIHLLVKDKFVAYGNSPILPSLQSSITDILFCLGDNLFWLATTAGLVKLDLKRICNRQLFLKNAPPITAITFVYNNGQEIYHYPQNITQKNRKLSEVNYTQNNFGFSFAGLSFAEEKAITYQYKLQGTDPFWSKPVSSNEVQYRSLAPGDYTFKAYSINPDGIRSLKPATFSFRILPPFWQQSWFILILSSFCVYLFIIIINHLSTRRLKKKVLKLEHEKSIQETRQRTRELIARNLHDDVSSTLSSISLFVDALKIRIENKPDEAIASINRLYDLTHEAEDAIEDVVWSLSADHNKLGDLIVRIADLAPEICINNKIKCKLDIEEGAKNIQIEEQYRKNIYLIFKESMHNIIKHSQAKTINIGIYYNNNIFKLQIRDDGCGCDLNHIKSTGKGGNGLNNMRFRASEIGANLIIESSLSRGTSITLTKEITQMCH